MINFDNIEEQLEGIIATTRNIVKMEEQDQAELETIKKLMLTRSRQLQILSQADMNKRQLTEAQKETIRNFFTRFYILDKKMNRFFDELSLHYELSIQGIENHKKAEQAYSAEEPTNILLNAPLTG
jgi:hypothetical protein